MIAPGFGNTDPGGVVIGEVGAEPGLAPVGLRPRVKASLVLKIIRQGNQTYV